VYSSSRRWLADKGRLIIQRWQLPRDRPLIAILVDRLFPLYFHLDTLQRWCENPLFYPSVSRFNPFLVVWNRLEPRVPRKVPGTKTWQEVQVHHLQGQRRFDGDHRREGVERRRLRGLHRRSAPGPVLLGGIRSRIQDRVGSGGRASQQAK
jgi:hypothetical protein